MSFSISGNATAMSAVASLTVQSDGKIVVAGGDRATTSDMIVERFNSDGAVDTSFGTAGVERISFAGKSSSATSVVMEGTSKATVCPVKSSINVRVPFSYSGQPARHHHRSARN